MFPSPPFLPYSKYSPIMSPGEYYYIHQCEDQLFEPLLQHIRGPEGYIPKKTIPQFFRNVWISGKTNIHSQIYIHLSIYLSICKLIY